MKAGHDDQARIHHELRHFGDTPDVFHTIGVGEAQVFVEPGADIVAIENIGALSLAMELDFEGVGDRRFAGARKPVNQITLPGWPF